jgi:aryl-alcohol dehydrogenase-like predicted oxidoreductase
VAEKHNTVISNVAARWVLDKPTVAGIIVGARNAVHVRDHRSLMSLHLDQADRDRIHMALQAGRRPVGDVYDWERGGAW